MEFDGADSIAVTVVLFLALVPTLVLLRRNGSDERKVLLVSFGLHVAFSFALRFSQGGIFNEGDVGYYRAQSTPLLGLMKLDPAHYIPRVFGANFHFAGEELGIDTYSSTVSMTMTLALGRLITGDSMWAFYIVSAYGSFLAKWMVYAVVRDELPSVDRRVLAICTLCIPSVVFWTSGVVKETYAFIGIGPALFGAQQIIRARYPIGITSALFGAVLVATYKPYLLFPFAVAFSVWAFFERGRRFRKYATQYLVVGLVFGFALIVGLGAVFPQFSLARISEQTMTTQMYGVYAGGGSFYGGIEATTPAAQVAKAPLALLASLTRPWPWEATNVSSSIAALEMLTLTIFLIRAVRMGGRGSLKRFVQIPLFLFCTIFVVIGGVAIGLTTPNFGTLSRYRVPIMPFYAVAVALVTLRSKASAPTSEKTIPPVATMTMRRRPKTNRDAALARIGARR